MDRLEWLVIYVSYSTAVSSTWSNESNVVNIKRHNGRGNNFIVRCNFSKKRHDYKNKTRFCLNKRYFSS